MLLTVLISTLVSNSGHHSFRIGSLATVAFSTLNALVSLDLKVNNTPWCIKRINSFYRWPCIDRRCVCSGRIH